MTATEKKCYGCNEIKPVSEFSKNNKSKDGLTYYCKVPCSKNRNAEYRAMNHEILKAKKSSPEALARQRELYLRPEKKKKEYARNRNAARIRQFRNSMYQRLYGIGIEKYEFKFRSQNGACAICEKQNLDGKPLVVDHDHATGIVRDLLCNRCNQAIGSARDNLKILAAMFDYIERWDRVAAVKR